MMKVVLLAVCGLVLVQGISSAEAAEGWLPRLRCDGANFVVDGLHSFADGFTNHQIVIRDPNAVAYLGSQSMNLVPINNSGEIVVALNSKDFNGSFEVQLGIAHPNRPDSGYQESLQGHWLAGGRYEVDLMRLSVYSGMSYHSASQVADWVFNNCHN